MPALWKSDYDTDGFHWIDCSDHLNSVLSFLRQDAEHFNELVVIANLTPVPRLQYRIGLPRPGPWRELLNSDAAVYGGSNMGNAGGVAAADKPWHRQPCSAEFILPPLSILVFRPERAADKVIAVAAEALPEKAPETSQAAKQAADPSQAIAASGGDAFHRMPDSVLKALEAVASVPAGVGVRPSPGEASSNPPRGASTPENPPPSDGAAPEDGRTPVARPKGAEDLKSGVKPVA